MFVTCFSFSRLGLLKVSYHQYIYKYIKKKQSLKKLITKIKKSIWYSDIETIFSYTIFSVKHSLHDKIKLQNPHRRFLQNRHTLRVLIWGADKDSLT